MKTISLIIFFLLVFIFSYILFRKTRQLKEQEKTLIQRISNFNQQIAHKQNQILQLKILQQQEQTILDTRKKTRQNELQQIERDYEEQRIKHRQSFHQSINRQVRYRDSGIRFNRVQSSLNLYIRLRPPHVLGSKKNRIKYLFIV